MAICDAAGPCGSSCGAPASVVACTYGSKFCTTPWLTRSTANTNASGRNT